MELTRKITTGMLHINDQLVNDEPNAPFGGEKGSGFGWFNGECIIEELTSLQWATVQHKKEIMVLSKIYCVNKTFNNSGESKNLNV